MQERYLERSIDVVSKDATNAAEICRIGLVDELEAHGYLCSIDYKCELSDFLWPLQQLKNHTLVDAVIETTFLNGNESIEVWGRKINADLDGKAFVCTIDINNDSYGIFISDAAVYEKILDTTRNYCGNVIDSF